MIAIHDRSTAGSLSRAAAPVAARSHSVTPTVIATGSAAFHHRPWITCSSSATAPVSGPPAAAPAEREDDSPEAAVRRVAQGLQENRPQVLWESLPPSYRTDVNALVRNTAQRMDPEIWSRSVAIVRRAAALLKAKREFLLQHPGLHDNAALFYGI